jgi:aspartate kinase
MQVIKFGGTSVKDADAIKKAVKIIQSKEDKTAIVVSAFATVTNNLESALGALENHKFKNAKKLIDEVSALHYKIAEDLNLGQNVIDYIYNKIEELGKYITSIEILGEVTPRSRDLVLSIGELLSSYIIFNVLLYKGVSIRYVDPRSLIITDSNYTKAEVIEDLTEKSVGNNCNEIFENHDLIITGGFVAADEIGRTTTLGRGGSDYTAAILASVLDAKTLEVWTDVPGIMTSDPRMTKNAKIINEISYTEAAELAFFGAKVLHPKTISPAIKKNIPVYVRDTFHPDFQGTKIVHIRNNNRMVKAIAFRKGIFVINIASNRMLGAYGFLNKVFEIFKKYETSIDLVATTEVSISCTIDDNSNLKKIREELKLFSNVTIKKDMAIICAVGEGIRNTAGIAARFFGVLKGINISMVSIGASEVNLSVVVSAKTLEQSVNLLHDEFFSGKLDNNVFSEFEN